MNDEEGLFSTRDGLPEVVKRNTIAMELICTERTFCDGKKRDRLRFISLFQEIGNYLEIMTSLVEESLSYKEAIGISSPPLKVNALNCCVHYLYLVYVFYVGYIDKIMKSFSML
jgi:hypothetical protein